MCCLYLFVFFVCARVCLFVYFCLAVVINFEELKLIINVHCSLIEHVFK